MHKRDGSARPSSYMEEQQMNQRPFQAALAFMLALAATTSAGPIATDSVLLASFAREGGVVNASATVRIGFVMEISNSDTKEYSLVATNPLHSTRPFFLPNRLWNDGESGTLELSEATDAGFAGFVAALTDDRDDRLTLWSSWDTLVGGVQARGGSFGLESSFFAAPNDLLGADIEITRLHVDEISYAPTGLLGPEWSWNFTAEAFGTNAIAEPTAGILMWLGSAILAFRAR